MPADPELLSILLRLFPSFRGLPPGEADRRAEGLGLFAAQAWAAGPDGLKARGMAVAPPVHAGLAAIAPRVVQARNGGATFLLHVRKGMADDATFATFATALAKVYAESLRAPAAGAAAPQAAAAPQTGAAPAPALAAPAEAVPLGFGVPRRPTKEMQSFEALLGSGELAPIAAAPPGGAPPARPQAAAPPQAPPARPAAPPAPARPQPAGAGAGSSDVARALARGLDLMPDDEPRAAPPPKPAPRPAAPTPKADYGGLDLMPEDAPAPPRPAAKPSPAAPAPKADLGGLDLMPADEPPEPAAPAMPGVEEFVPGGDDEDDAAPPARGAPPARSGGGGGGGGGSRQSLDMAELEQAQQEQTAKDPALAAIRRFERSGNPAALDEAERHLKQEMAQAPHDPARAMAAAGLARVELLRGKAAEAERLAKAAQTKDPSNPLAVEVLVRLSRGEAELAAVQVAVAQLRAVFDQRDGSAMRTMAERFRKAWPDEPHAGLVLFVVGKMNDDAAQVEAGLKEAWARFPSPRTGHLAWGGSADADISDYLVDYGREPLRGKDEAALRRTVENVDDKQNVIAGALRMGVAIARVALSKGPSRDLQKRMNFTIARGLVGLQYFDAALPWIGKSTCLGPSAEESKMMSNERINAGALRRAFDRPGIKAQLGAYQCLGVRALSSSIQGRMEAARKDREKREQECFARGADLAAKARTDAALKGEIKRAAQEAGVPDPLQPIEAAEAELAAIEKERAAGQGDKKDAGGGGLFGKLKAAASSAVGAAKDGLNQLKASQATARRDDAHKQLAVTLARKLTDATWQHPMLKAFAREAALLEAFTDYVQAEESRGQKELAQLADAVAG